MELGEPENVELRLDDDGVKRWYLSTREDWPMTRPIAPVCDFLCAAEIHDEGSRDTGTGS